MSAHSLLSAYKEDPARPLESEDFPVLLTALQSPDDSLVIDTLQLLGDLNREEPPRKAMAEHPEITSQLAAMLEETSPEKVQLVARALGNFCYQDENNRQRLVDLDVPLRLVKLLKETDDASTQRNVTGALANVSFVSDELQAKLVQEGALPLLFKGLQSSEELVVVMSLRAIGNVVDGDSHRPAFKELDGVATLVELAFSHSSALVRSDALTTLSNILEDSSADLEEFARKDDWLPRMHHLAKADEDEQVRTDGWAFLLLLAGKQEIMPLFSERGILDALMKDVQLDADTVPLASTLQLLGLLASNDQCMDVIFQLFSVFFPLLRHEDENIQTYTAMIVGNIARNDANCARLVEAGAVPILKGLCSGPSRVQNLVLGALRNIAIPDQNKEAVANEDGLIAAVLQCIAKGTNAHVLFHGVILLKVLAAGGESFVKQLILEDVLKVMADLMERELDEGQQRIHFEASRLLMTIALTNDNYLELVMNQGGCKSMSLLLSTSFDLLHKEALEVLLVVSGRETFQEQIAESSLVNDLVGIVPAATEETRPMIVQALQNLVQQGNSTILEALRKPETQEAISQLPGTEEVISKLN